MKTVAVMLIAVLAVPLLMAGAGTGTAECCGEPLFNSTSTAIPKGLDWYFVVVFGDNRPEDTGSVELPGVFYRILEEARLLGPYALIGTGDHVGEGREAQYQELWWALQGFENVLLVPGNHDLLISGSEERWERYVGPRYWVWEAIPGWSVIGVDTYDRLLPRFQRETVSAFEESHGPNRILVTHYPLEPDVGYNIESKAPSGSTKARLLQRMISEYNVSIVLQGHWHGYAEKRVNNTLYIITGGAGAPLYSLRTEKTDADYYRTQLNHYLVLILEPTGRYRALPIYTGKGKITVERPAPWEAHVYQDKYLINGTPADLPVRIELERNGTRVTVQFIAPHAEWVNITLHTGPARLEISGNPLMLQAYYTGNSTLLDTREETRPGKPVMTLAKTESPISNTGESNTPGQADTGPGEAAAPSSGFTSWETLLALAVIITLALIKKIVF